MLSSIVRASSSRLTAAPPASGARLSALSLFLRAHRRSPAANSLRPLSSSLSRYRPIPSAVSRQAAQRPPEGLADTPGLGHELVHPQTPPPEVAPLPGTIIDKFLPKWAEGAKPYLLLTRFDKPIGSALLFWPCSRSRGATTGPGNLFTGFLQHGPSRWQPRRCTCRHQCRLSTLPCSVSARSSCGAQGAPSMICGMQNMTGQSVSPDL